MVLQDTQSLLATLGTTDLPCDVRAPLMHVDNHPTL